MARLLILEARVIKTKFPMAGMGYPPYELSVMEVLKAPKTVQVLVIPLGYHQN